MIISLGLLIAGGVLFLIFLILAFKMTKNEREVNFMAVLPAIFLLVLSAIFKYFV